MSEIIIDGSQPTPKKTSRRTSKKTSENTAVHLPGVVMSKGAAENKRLISLLRKSTENEIRLTNPTDFFNEISSPVESKLFSFMKKVKESSEEMLDTNGSCRIIEYDLVSNKWRWKTITSSSQLKTILNSTENAYAKFMKLREAKINEYLRKREDAFGGMGFADDTSTDSQFGLQVRQEFTPLIGTPFYKQMYLYDYWQMHSKCFWYSNYSGIAKLIVDMTRNFVMGKAFNVQFENEKCQEVWNKYEDYSNIQEEARNWCDDLTKFGENMIKKVITPKGIQHRSFDPSTIWEIVTDPENINDIKYYHQQYNTQYQIYQTKTAPVSKYIIDQIPPQLVIHSKVNVTSFEKRGRSDLLAPLLYFKYYEDYMQAKMARAKNEAAFIWDVEIDGSDEDVQFYINNSANITDVPPGSENVHNKAIKRTPLSPTLSKGNTDQAAQDILSYVAMAVSIPVNYMGTFGTGGYTKAGALVATEPVAKKMIERQTKMEHMIRKVVRDVLIDADMNPDDPKNAFEINFAEILAEDRSAKIQDLVIAKDEKVIAHETMSYIVAKELNITKYDYQREQDRITKESKNPLFAPPAPDLTPDDEPVDDKVTRSFDRSKTKKDGLKI